MKIIHTADLHLDSRMKTNLTNEQALLRRSELLESFRRMVNYAADNGAEAVLISGDMFDRPVSKVIGMAKNLVMDVIIKNPDISFYYLKGNHDEGDLSLEFDRLPDNLYFFDKEWRDYRIGRRVVVCGAELTGDNNMSLYDSLALDATDINIVMLHGNALRFGADGDRDAISLTDLKNKSIDYLALGHIHKYDRQQLDGRGIFCYPGCLEPRGFDETGEHGFVMLGINEETGEISDTFVPFASRNAFICHADVTGATSMTEATDMIEEAFDEAGYTADDMVELYIEGDVEVDCEIDEVYILNRFKTRFFAFKCKKLTRVRIDYDAFTLDASLKGEFVNLVRDASDISEDDKGTIIQLGISLLANPDSLKN